MLVCGLGKLAEHECPKGVRSATSRTGSAVDHDATLVSSRCQGRKSAARLPCRGRGVPRSTCASPPARTVEIFHHGRRVAVAHERRCRAAGMARTHAELAPPLRRMDAGPLPALGTHHRAEDRSADHHRPHPSAASRPGLSTWLIHEDARGCKMIRSGQPQPETLSCCHRGPRNRRPRGHRSPHRRLRPHSLLPDPTREAAMAAFASQRNHHAR